MVALTLLASGLSGCGTTGKDGNTVTQPLSSGIGGSSVTLSWTPPTENADNSPLLDLAGYKFYYGPSDGNYTNSIYVNNAGLSSYTVSNLPANTYYFVVTAVNQSGAESAFSNAAVWVVQ